MTESQCPHCHAPSKSRIIKGSTNAALVMMLGLGVVGCSNDSDKDDTSSSYIDPSSEPEYGVVVVETGMDTATSAMYGVPDTGIEPAAEPEYGVPMIDDDGDGFYQDIDDCDDSDPNTFPGAAARESETECMKDTDGDNFGDDSPSNPNVTPGTDCDDDDQNIYPGNGC